jgi:hypothetical protein
MVTTRWSHVCAYLYGVERAIDHYDTADATGSVNERLLATAGLAVVRGNWLPEGFRTVLDIS